VMLRFENFQMPQRRVIQREKIAALIERDAREMIHVAAQILREIMQRTASRADGGGLVLQAETVERGHLELLLDCVKRGFRRKCPIIVAAQDLKRTTQQIAKRSRLLRENNFRRAKSFQLGEQCGLVLQFGREEIAGGQIHQREAEDFSVRINRREKIISLGDEHPLVEMRAGRKDLRDLTIHQFSWTRVFGLIADGHLASGFENARDVAVCRVMRQTAHRDAVAGGEREVQQLRAGLRVLEKHLIEIAEAEEQQRVLRQFAFDAAILRHHGSELRFGGLYIMRML